MRLACIFLVIACFTLSFASPTYHPTAHGDTGGHGNNHHESHSGEHPTEDGQLVVLGMCFIVACGLLFEMIQDTIPTTRILPFTVIIFFLSGALGMWLEMDATDDFNRSLERFTSIKPHTFLTVFIPPLLYESASQMNFHLFRRGLGQSLVLAGPGVLLNTFLTGLLAWAILPYNWSYAQAALFGSIVSATDPVAVVSLLKSLGASKRLSTLIESESLLNDGSAFVVWAIILDFVKHDAGTAGEIVETALQLSLGGVAIGLLLGWASSEWIHHVFENAKVEIGITVLASYFTFYFAEVICESSGVLATVFMGLVHAHSKPISAKTEHPLHNVWESLSFFMETAVFFFAGLIIGTKHDLLAWIDLLWVFVMYFVLHVTRLITVACSVPFLNVLGPGISWQDSCILVYGALRGAIGLALVLLVELDVEIEDEHYKEELMAQVALTIVLTLLINATTIKYLLQFLGLTDRSLPEKMSLNDAVNILEKEVNVTWKTLKASNKYQAVEWREVKEYLPHVHTDASVPSLFKRRARTTMDVLGDCPVAAELSEQLPDIVRRSVWRSFKQAMEELFEENVAKRHQVDFLSELVDTAMDETPMDIQVIIKGIERKFEDGPVMRWFAKNRCLRGLGHFLMYKKHRHSVEMCFLFLEAVKNCGTLKMLAKFHMDRADFVKKISDEFLCIQGEVSALLSMFRHEYPELMKRIMTDTVVRRILSSYRTGVDELAESGILEDSVAHELEEEIFEKMREAFSGRSALRSFFKYGSATAITCEQVFKNTQLGEVLGAQQLDQIWAKVEKIDLKKGDLLIRKGDKPGGLYVITSGVLCGEMGASTLFMVAGEMLLEHCLNSRPFEYNVKVFSEHALAYRISHDDMRMLLEDPVTSERLNRIAAYRYVRSYCRLHHVTIPVGRIFEGGKSDFMITPEKGETRRFDFGGFIMRGSALTHSGPIEIPGIVRSGTYALAEGTVYFLFHEHHEEIKYTMRGVTKVLSAQSPSLNNTFHDNLSEEWNRFLSMQMGSEQKLSVRRHHRSFIGDALGGLVSPSDDDNSESEEDDETMGDNQTYYDVQIGEPANVDIELPPVTSTMKRDAQTRVPDSDPWGWSAEEVGDWVASLGANFRPYRRLFVDNALDGKMLDMVTKRKTLEEIGITKMVHQTKISRSLEELLSGDAEHRSSGLSAKSRQVQRETHEDRVDNELKKGIEDSYSEYTEKEEVQE